MRWRFLALIALAPSLSFAGEGLLGTKLSSTSTFGSTASSPVAGSAILQLLAALGIVLLLIRYVLPTALTKVNRKMHTNVTGGIQIEESASFAGGNLYVVNARSKTLLLSVTGTSVSCLADLTEPRSNQPEVKTFNEMLDEAPGAEPKFSEELDRTDADPFAETLARLDRLDRFTK